MKPQLTLNLGRETTDDEIEEILSAFSPYLKIEVNKSIVRLSADWLPLIIDFTIAAAGGGLLYDGLKGALITLQEKFKQKKLERKPTATIHVKNETYILTDEKIFLQSIDIELSFNTIEEFVEYIQEKTMKLLTRQINSGHKFHCTPFATSYLRR